MKRLLLLLLFCEAGFAAGAVSSNIGPIGNSSNYLLMINWAGDSVNGSVPASSIAFNPTLTPVQGYRISGFEILPGTPSPSANYSMTLVDIAGVDVLLGSGASLSATTSSSLAASTAVPPITGPLTFNLTGNSVAGAQGKLFVYLAPALSTTLAVDSSGKANVNVTNTPSVAQSGAPWSVQGPVASGSANADNPMKIGGVFNTTQPTVTNGQIVDAQTTARGAQIVATGVDALNNTPTAGVPDVTGSGTINGNNQSVTISTAGINSFSYQMVSGNNLIATLQCQFSNDGGTTWINSYVHGTTATSFVWFGLTTGNTVSSSSGIWTCLLPGGASNARVTSTAFTSGSAVVNVRGAVQPEELQFQAGPPASIIPPIATMIAGSDYSGPPAVLRTLRTDTQGNAAIDKGISVFKTYQSELLAWSIATTPTDIAFLPGNASNTVLVTRVELSCTQTTAGTADVLLARRTAANTGGTTTAFNVNVPFDTNDSAASSSPLAYTANAATITGDGTFVSRKVFIPATGTASAGTTFVWTPEPMGKPIMLRGTAQSININLNGQTLTGLTCDAEFQWIETNLI